jgi:hypothetical protein
MPLPHVRLARVLCLAFRSPLRSVRCTTSCGAIPHCSPQCVCHADEPHHALRRLAPRLVAVRMQARLRPQRRRALAQLAAGGRVAVNRQRLRVGEDVGVRDREVHRWRAQLPLFGVQVRMRSHTRRRAAVNDSEIYRSLKHSKRDQCAGEPPSAVPPSAVRPSAGPAPCGPAPCRAHSRAAQCRAAQCRAAQRHAVHTAEPRLRALAAAVRRDGAAEAATAVLSEQPAQGLSVTYSSAYESNGTVASTALAHVRRARLGGETDAPARGASANRGTWTGAAAWSRGMQSDRPWGR